MAKKNTDYTGYSLPSEQNETAKEVEKVEAVAAKAEKPAAKENKGVVVNCVRLNVRETPAPNGKVIEILDKGNIVTIISSDVGWYKIKTASKKTGYVMAQYIEKK